MAEQTDLNDPVTVARNAYRRGWTELPATYQTYYAIGGAKGRQVDLSLWVWAEAIIARVWAEEATP